MTNDTLERDLRGLAQPLDTDAELRRRIAAELTHRTRARRSRRALLLAGAALVAVAVAVGALVGVRGGGGPTAADAAVVHHALRAVTPPPNTILHVRVVDATGAGGEWWQETSAPYASLATKGLAGDRSATADDGTTTAEYDPASNTIREHPDVSPPRFDDPVSEIQKALRSGDAQLAGTVRIGGESLYKIDLPGGSTAYFAKRDFRPRYFDNPDGDRFTVVSYGFLPPTAANLRLLDLVAQHPDAQVVHVSAPSKQ
jgi:hypothetical protein